MVSPALVTSTTCSVLPLWSSTRTRGTFEGRSSVETTGGGMPPSPEA